VPHQGNRHCSKAAKQIVPTEAKYNKIKPAECLLISTQQTPAIALIQAHMVSKGFRANDMAGDSKKYKQPPTMIARPTAHTAKDGVPAERHCL